MQIKLNPRTTELTALLDRIKDNEEMSLGELAAAGAKIRKAKVQSKYMSQAQAKAKAKSYTKKAVARAKTPKAKVAAKAVGKARAAKASGKGGFMAALWGGLGKAVAKGSAVAERFGVEMPGKKELNQLKEIKSKISSITFRAKTYGPGGTVYNSLLKRKDPTTDALADKLGASARQVTAQAVAVGRAVDSAITEGEAAFKSLSGGKISAMGTGAFLLKHKQALDQFKQLDLRANAMTEAYQSGIKQVDGGPAIAKEVATIARQTMSEAGGKAAAFAQEAGAIAEQAVEAAGEGAKSAAGMMKYLPYLAIAAAGAYIFISAAMAR